MFRIAVCDDEGHFRKQIRKILLDYMDQKGVLYDVDEFESGKDFVSLGVEIVKYKIVFLDIYMEQMNGMITAQRIREISNDIYIVFCYSSTRTFQFNEGTRNIPLERLIYIESRLHKLEFYIMEDRINKYTLYSTLNDMEKELEGNDFLRIHQSYLVNMKHIAKVSRYEVLLNNGRKLEIPKARYKYVEETYILYKGEV